jgi:hypothetical protein
MSNRYEIELKEKLPCPICTVNFKYHTPHGWFTLEGLESHLINFHKRVDYKDLIKLSVNR